MCDNTEEFSTAAGSRDSVRWFLENWEQLGLRTLGVTGVAFDDLASHDGHYEGAPGLAVIFHEPGQGARIVAHLTATTLVEQRLPPGAPLLFEAGHYYRAASAGGPAALGPLLDPQQVTRALAVLPSVPQANGARVALLDTGNSNSPNPVVDLTGPVLQYAAPTPDPHGHGTAVAEAVRAVAPYASIDVVRVLDATCSGTSVSVYQGLIVALWDPVGYDVVNASLGVDAQTACGTSLGATFNFLMTLRGVAAGGPRLVAAAGNHRTTLRAPATVSGATVVTATDFGGATAPYCRNLQLGTGVNAVAAPGGTAADPLGTYRSGQRIYGTSFAAGFVTGAMLR